VGRWARQRAQAAQRQVHLASQAPQRRWTHDERVRMASETRQSNHRRVPARVVCCVFLLCTRSQHPSYTTHSRRTGQMIRRLHTSCTDTQPLATTGRHRTTNSARRQQARLLEDVRPQRGVGCRDARARLLAPRCSAERRRRVSTGAKQGRGRVRTGASGRRGVCPHGNRSLHR